ncbi:DAPK1 [Symbiodinium sp. CCMP2592]|nr:DAPK1 [Symbiodinium sp. CCMP2592]
MPGAGLVLLAALALADSNRVSTPGNLADSSSMAEQRKLFRSLLKASSISWEQAAKDGNVAALAAHLQAGNDLNARTPWQRWTAAHFAAAKGPREPQRQNRGRIYTGRHSCPARPSRGSEASPQGRRGQNFVVTPTVAVYTEGSLARAQAAGDQDEKAEVTEKPIAETSVPPTTTTTSITTTRGRPPAISLADAARNGDVAALKKHLQAGTDVNAKLAGGWTAAHYAATYGHVAALKFLHEAGSDLNAADSLDAGWTAAHYAAFYGHPAALKFLHQAGANLKATQKAGSTPAYLAAWQGKAEALEALAKAGADLQKANLQGRTPAHGAAYAGHVDALRVLIQAGVDLNVQDSDGNTPADAAAKQDHPEELKLLLEAGGKRNKA